ncbi:hypothetical protein ACD591_17730 [Rufibacter glacialis]|uniref:Uncharacterized protein n=1 Tax=Rufibacter glacialis TaxID=1259555 RepID=A0A5M8Q726_9BACT|nr:hypothetical protein [Rufibacter glacialis]KAA6430686.1 hypothetical protein FOE74_19655 [Rufibacter glacialis]GGK85805.1 hypothetical protein GCM10011405_37050 [Rufibacter glacialis]
MALTDFLNKIKKEWEVLKGENSKDKFFYNENTYPDEATAQREFARTKEKLFNVNSWSLLTGINSTFQLFDAQGNPSDAPRIQEGDYMQIILPATSIENWVTAIEVTEEEEAAQLVVRPCPKPEAQKNDQEGNEVKHFFSEEATSTFRVVREGTKIMGMEIGRNEVINNTGEQAGNRPILNTLISEGGWAGFQALQWDKITRYYVHLEEAKA